MHHGRSTEDRVFTRTSAAEVAVNDAGPGMDDALTCGQLLETEFRQWDDFVQAHPRSSPFHLLAWKRTIEESFRYRPYYLVARGGDRVRIDSLVSVFASNNASLTRNDAGLDGGIPGVSHGLSAVRLAGNPLGSKARGSRSLGELWRGGALSFALFL